MGKDVYEKIRWDNIQYLIAFHCAPVLAGIKISNLLVTDNEGAMDVNKLLDGTKIEVYELSRLRGKVVLLLFNRCKLAEYLGDKTNAHFLRSLGHNKLDVTSVLKELACRYSDYERGVASFPHELGIVLGYPVGDVYGFMANDGQNYILSGYWKVYSRADKARDTFRAYDDCTENIMRALISGNNLTDIVGVCAV